MGITTTLRERRQLADVGANDALVCERIPVDQVRPNPHQPRQFIDEGSDAFLDLVGSIRERGLIQPIAVWSPAPDTYVLIGGERRLRAFRRLARDDAEKFGTIPAVIAVTVEGDSDASMLMAGLIENVIREDLKPGDRAASVVKLRELTSWSHDEIAQRMGVSRATLQRLAAIGKHDSIVDAVNSGDITVAQASAIGHSVGDDGQLAAELIGVAKRHPKEAIGEVAQHAVRTSTALPAEERARRAEAAVLTASGADSVQLSNTALAALKPRVKEISRDDYIAVVRKAWKELRVMAPANRR